MAKLDLADVYSRNVIAATDKIGYSLGHLEGGLQDYDWRDDADYQRAYRWTDEQASAFMGHFLMGGLVNPIIWNVTSGDKEAGPFWVVDGKQRMRAILRWLHDEIHADIEGAKVYRRDCEARLPLDLRVNFWIVQLDEIGVRRLYLRLNRAGTPHTAEELAKVERQVAKLEAAR
jgi:hypothetical protein